MTGSYPDCTDSREVFLFDHSTPESDLYQTSHYKVTPKSNIKITEEKKEKKKEKKLLIVTQILLVATLGNV